MAARRRRHQDEDDVPVAARLHRPYDGGDGIERTADAGLPQRRPRQGDLPGRPPRRDAVPGQGPRRHLGDRPGPAGLHRRDDPQLSRPDRQRQHHGGHAPGCRQAVARRTAAGCVRQGGRGPAFRRPGPGLPSPQRHERQRLAEPPQRGHRRRRQHGGADPSREAEHRLRLAGGRRRRPVHHQGRHLRRRGQGDRAQRQPPGDRRPALHPPRPARSAAAPPRSSRTPACRRSSKGI